MIDECRIKITWKARHYDYANTEVVPDLYWVCIDGWPVVAATTALSADNLTAQYAGETDTTSGRVEAVKE